MMELALRFTHAAVHVLWIGALLALAVYAVERLLVRSAAGRHAVHLTGLLLTCVVFGAVFLTASVQVTPLVSAPEATVQERGSPPLVENAVPIAEVGNFVPPELMPPMETEPVRPDPIAVERRPVVKAPPKEPVAVSRWEKAAPWVAGAYLIGLLGMVLRMTIGLVGSARLRRLSDPVESELWIDALERMTEALKRRTRPILKWSKAVAAPVLVGVVKPMILLPLALANRLTPEQVEAVLAHELAHLCRKDSWALAVQRVVETILFFHPVIWWMSHRMNIAREEACDDLVLAAGCDPADYAEALIVCSECRAEKPRFAGALATSRLAATGKGRGLLRRRILRLIGGGDDGAVRLGRIGWVLGLLLVGGVVLAISAGRARGNSPNDSDLNDDAFYTLYDLESGRQDGALNLMRECMETMTAEKWRTPPIDAVLVAEIASNEIGVGIAGAKHFIMTDAGEVWDDSEALSDLLIDELAEQTMVPIESDGALFHLLTKQQVGHRFAFAVEMPASHPVAGVLEIQKIDLQAETIEIRSRFLSTEIARAIVSTEKSVWGKSTDGVAVRVDDMQLQSGNAEWPHAAATIVYSATNMGPYQLHFPENGKWHQIEVDGQWYEWQDFGSFEINGTNINVSKISYLLMFDSGKGFTNQTIQVNGGWRALPNGMAENNETRRYEDYGDELVLSPGKHQIRIAILSSPVGTNLDHKVRAVSDPFEVDVADQPTREPEELDYTLEVKISSTRRWQRGCTITIQSDGTYTFEMQTLRAVPGEDRLVPNDMPYIGEYRLSPGDLIELERLIQATDGLKMEEPIGPHVPDATEYAMTLTLASGQTQRVVSNHQENPDAYTDLIRFISRIERQEELLYGILYDENPYHIAESLMNELDALIGAPNRLMPIAPALDYHRLVPAYSALLEQVDTSAQVMIAGIKLIGFLKLESHRKTLESILLNASEESVRAEAATAISRMGVVRSMEVMKAAVEDQTAPIDAIAEALISAPSDQSLPMLEKLAARSQGAAWALIRTPESQETILKVLYQPIGDNVNRKAAYNIIRMYYDHRNDSSFRPSPPVLAAIHDKVIEAALEGSSSLQGYGQKVINLSGDPFVIRNAWQQLNETLLLIASKDQERRKALLLKEHFRDNEPADGFMQDAANGELSVRQVYADALYNTGWAYMVGAQGKNHYVVRLAMKSGIAWAMEDAQRVEPPDVQAKLERYLVNYPAAKEVAYDDAPKRDPSDERANSGQSISSIARNIMTAVQESDFETLHRLSAGSLIGWVQPEEAQELNKEIPDGWSIAALDQGVEELLQMYEARPRLLTEFNGVEVKEDWAGVHAYGPRGKLYDPELVIILKRIDGQWRLVNLQQAQKTLAEDLEQSADRFLELEARLLKLREIREKQQAGSVWGEVSNGLQCRLLPLEQELEPSADGSSVYVTYELRNVGDYAVQFLPWYCPLEGVLGGNVFSVLDEDGNQVAYFGKYLERMLPTKESFITIALGQTVTNRVALPYDFSKPGTYRVQTQKQDLSGASYFYYDNNADAVAANPDHVWTGKLASNEVLVTVKAQEEKPLPSWITELDGNGLTVTLDDDGEVSELSAKSIMTDELLSKLPELPHLKGLYVGLTTNITSAGLAYLGELKSLERLSLRAVNVGPVTPGSHMELGSEVMEVIGTLPRLSSLEISNLLMTDEKIKQLPTTMPLESITLAALGISDESLRHLASIPSLTEISIFDRGETASGRDGRNFSINGLLAFRNLPNLRRLTLNGFDIPGGDYSRLGELTQLHSLAFVQVWGMPEEQISRLRQALPSTTISAPGGAGQQTRFGIKSIDEQQVAFQSQTSFIDETVKIPLEMGLAYETGGGQFSRRPGDICTFTLLAKNTGPKTVTLKDYIPFVGWTPKIRTSRGEQQINVSTPPFSRPVQERITELKPGETFEIGTIRLRIGQDSELPSAQLEAGDYLITMEYRFAEINGTASNESLLTGDLTLHVVEPAKDTTPISWGETDQSLLKFGIAYAQDHLPSSVTSDRLTLELFACNEGSESTVLHDFFPGWMPLIATPSGTPLHAVGGFSLGKDGRIAVRNTILKPGEALKIGTVNLRSGYGLVPNTLSSTSTYSVFLQFPSTLGINNNWSAKTGLLKLPAEMTQQSLSSDPRELFIAVERFARLPKEEQAERLPQFYRQLPSRTLSMIVEGILSSYPHEILNRQQVNDAYDGNTDLWAQQLADAASDLSAEEVADNLEISLWLNVASRARAMWVFEQYSDTIKSLISDDLYSGDLLAIERAAGVIQALNLTEFAERLLEIWIDGNHDQTSPIWSALIFMVHSGILPSLLEQVEEDPKMLIRCAGLFQGPLQGKPAEPVLLNLLDDSDPEIRYAAAYALMECVDERLAQPMAKMADGSESRFRLIAAHQISLLPEEVFKSVRDQLLSLLNDSDEEVRFSALQGVGKRRDLAAGPVILELLQQELLDEQYKVWTMQALSTLSGSTWNYYMHEWGPQRPGNQEAIEKFEFWLRGKLSETTPWGKPNGGLAVRLRSDYPPAEEGEMLFQLDAKNIGDTDIVLARLLEGCWLEVDGVWYSYVLVYDGDIPQPSRLEAGIEVGGFEVLRLSPGVNRNWLGGIAGEDGMIPQTLNAAAAAGLTHSLDLTPGRHTIRLAYIAAPEKPPEERVYAYSNPVEVWVDANSSYDDAESAIIRKSVEALVLPFNGADFNETYDWISDQGQQAVPCLLETYRSEAVEATPYIAELIFDAWRKGLLDDEQKQAVAETAVRSVAFADGNSAFPEGNRDVKIDIMGVSMSRSDRESRQIPWDFLEARLDVTLDRMHLEIAGGSEGAETRCSDSHYLKLPSDLPPGYYWLDVGIDFAEKEGDWSGRVERKVPFDMTRADGVDLVEDLPSQETVNGLRWKMWPESRTVEEGKPIKFFMSFQNVSSESIRILGSPTIRYNLTPTIYSPGNVEPVVYSIEHNPDEYIRSEDVVVIAPGETYRTAWSEVSSSVRGMTRLTVSYCSPKNTNPAVPLFWSGAFSPCDYFFVVVPKSGQMP